MFLHLIVYAFSETLLFATVNLSKVSFYFHSCINLFLIIVSDVDSLDSLYGEYECVCGIYV